MRAALALARRGLGTTAPNPSVGCILVEPGSGRVLGRGWTQPGGRPHAETEALARAGAAARGATVYVTLEPCAHHGRTAPCADALIAARVGRVVVATLDPDPRVAGRGLARLEAAGHDVRLGVGEAEAREVAAGFLLRIASGRPLVSLKLATTLDGRIATASGESRWITGAPARAHAHLLRAEHDAILIGSGTALADDPDLTCRLPGLRHRSPIAVVLDARRRLSPQSRLVRGAASRPVLVFVGEGGTAPDMAGVEHLVVPADPTGALDPASVLATLAARGITRVLVEGGAAVAASFLRAGLVDRLVWLRAPMLLGQEGHPAVGALGIERLVAAGRWERIALETLGADVAETLVPGNPAPGAIA